MQIDLSKTLKVVQQEIPDLDVRVRLDVNDFGGVAIILSYKEYHTISLRIIPQVSEFIKFEIWEKLIKDTAAEFLKFMKAQKKYDYPINRPKRS